MVLIKNEFIIQIHKYSLDGIWNRIPGQDKKQVNKIKEKTPNIQSEKIC